MFWLSSVKNLDVSKQLIVTMHHLHCFWASVIILYLNGCLWSAQNPHSQSQNKCNSEDYYRRASGGRGTSAVVLHYLSVWPTHGPSSIIKYCNCWLSIKRATVCFTNGLLWLIPLCAVIWAWQHYELWQIKLLQAKLLTLFTGRKWYCGHRRNGGCGNVAQIILRYHKFIMFARLKCRGVYQRDA